ncbi:MAG: hypothetical protein C0623_02090 [Desulfuromonas sp.]|nr:MAG: hypothetical protein C0623_02090 [Desulfuromonas sp.]
MNFIVQLLFPGGILFVGSCALLYSQFWLDLNPTHIDLFGLIVLVFGLFLSWRFDRNRLLYALLVLLIADLIERSFIPFPSRVSTHAIIAVLVPINFILLGVIKEKGIRTRHGLLHLSMIPLQVFLVYWWLEHWDGRYYYLLEKTHLPPHFGIIPDIYAGAVLLALLVQSFRYARYRNPVETAFIWSILCVAIAGVMTPGIETTFFRIVSALIIIISVFEMSYTLAYRDELTGLPGRRALQETFNKLGGQYAIAMADIDHFKKLNDTYGHDIGDQVLKMVAARLIRGSGNGLAFRYGGEEFCIVYRGKDTEATLNALESLRKTIADEPFIIRQRMRPVKKPKQPKQKQKKGQSLRVTISIGVAVKNDQSRNPADVLKGADLALYRAKKAGRNRVKT